GNGRLIEPAAISGNSSADDGTSTRKLRGSDRPSARIRERDSTSNVSDVKSIFGSEYQERRTAGSDLRSSRDIPAIVIFIPRGMDRRHCVDFNLPYLWRFFVAPPVVTRNVSGEYRNPRKVK